MFYHSRAGLGIVGSGWNEHWKQVGYESVFRVSLLARRQWDFAEEFPQRWWREKSQITRKSTQQKEICPSLLLSIHHRSIAWLAKWRQKRTRGQKRRRRKKKLLENSEKRRFIRPRFQGMKNCLKFIRARRSTWLDTVLLAHTADGEKREPATSDICIQSSVN